MKTTKPIVGIFQHSNHQILGGKAKTFRVPKSGDVYQFQMWLVEEKKYLRKTLKTKDLDGSSGNSSHPHYNLFHLLPKD